MIFHIAHSYFLFPFAGIFHAISHWFQNSEEVNFHVMDNRLHMPYVAYTEKTFNRFPSDLKQWFRMLVFTQLLEKWVYDVPSSKEQILFKLNAKELKKMFGEYSVLFLGIVSFLWLDSSKFYLWFSYEVIYFWEIRE